MPPVPPGPALGVEFLLSFALMFVIMAVATDDRVVGGFAGLAVGATVGFGALVGGPLTGASMNPARSLGPALAGGIWDRQWIYWVAPIAAMVCAGRVYEFLRAAAPPNVPRGPRPAAVVSPLDASGTP